MDQLDLIFSARPSCLHVRVLAFFLELVLLVAAAFCIAVLRIAAVAVFTNIYV